MTLTNQNKIRAKYLEKIMEYLGNEENGEDVGQIASNSLNFPTVSDEGEECWVEITIKIPKQSKTEDEEEGGGYAKREEYKISVTEKEAKQKEKEEKKKKKIARDKKIREEKEKEKKED